MVFQKYQTSSFDELVLWCDAIIIVYSISDRNSFAEAQRLKVMAKMKRRESKIIEVMTSHDLELTLKDNFSQHSAFTETKQTKRKIE